MFRPILHLFLPYRSFLAPILVVSAIVVPCWLLFRLYRHRKHGDLSFGREILLLAFVVYLCGLVAVTLVSGGNPDLRAENGLGIELPNMASLTCSSTYLPSGSSAQSFCVRNARGNVLLFLPLGAFILLVYRHLRFWRGLQIAIVVSIGIELAQYLSMAWGSYRTPDLNDVILNVLGASLGLALVSVIGLLRGPRPTVVPA